MGDVVILAQHSVSLEAVRAVLTLLEELRSGEVVGVAFVAIHRGTDYSVDAVGAAKDHPVFTRGALLVLDDQLAKIAGSR